jgi:potassium/chloride transporter 9
MQVPIPRDNVLAYTFNVTVDNSTHLVHNDTVTVFKNYTGLRAATFGENFYPMFTVDYTTGGKPVNFAIVFAVIFSGVTGIMAGANMSGELRAPQISIPRGTSQAVATTFCVYVLTTFLMGASCSR